MNKYVVTVVDYGDSCDGKARFLGIFDTIDEAKSYVRNDIEDCCDRYAGSNVVCDFDGMSATYGDCRSEWNIEVW